MDIIFNLIYLGFMAGFIISLWFFMLRTMDKMAKLEFDEAINKIEESPMALAVYFGARLLATAMLIAPLLRVII